ncbi:hypothetical protein HN615_16980 [Candidatus Woesearchaeota archaeon]|jgi:hypothetical protein|nr:hypothetical protein [Candidatus Woesearchaeota archaeon]
MDHRSNLFIVYSPLQIINAIEAIHHFKCKNNILVINYKPRQDKNNSQMDDLVEYHKWDEVIKVGSGSRRSKFLIYVKLIRRLKKVQYDYVFVAGFTSAIYTILANLKKNKLFIIDDGVGTIAAYNYTFAPNKPMKLRLKHIRFWLFGIRTKFNDRVDLFTYFNLKSLPHVSVERNNLSWFRKEYTSDATKDNVVYFLGLPHENDENHEAYAKILNKFIQKQSLKVVYVPHRYEKIRKSMQLVFDQFDVEVRQLGMPVEMYFLTNKIIPNTVSGVGSSAFFTLAFLYPETKYQSINHICNKSETHEIKEINKHLSEIGVEILNFKGGNHAN